MTKKLIRAALVLALLSVSGESYSQCSGVGALCQALFVARSITFTALAGGTVGGAAIAGSGAYTGTAPTGISTATWTGCGGGSATVSGFTNNTGSGVWNASFAPPGTAGTGCTLAIADNLTDPATSPGVTITAGASVALIAHTAAAAPTRTSNVVTSAINTTGANFLIVAVGGQCNTTPMVSDSLGNTFTTLDAVECGSSYNIRFFYVMSPAVGSSDIVTVNSGAADDQLAATVSAWSGMATSAVLDNSNSNAVGSASCATSLTPTAPNELVITSLAGIGTASVPTVSAGFTVIDALAGTAAPTSPIMTAYQLQTTATAVTPTVTQTGGSLTVCMTAAFKP